MHGCAGSSCQQEQTWPLFPFHLGVRSESPAGSSALGCYYKDTRQQRRIGWLTCRPGILALESLRQEVNPFEANLGQLHSVTPV